jgi:hypothetical protein
VARIRTVKPEFWVDEKVVELTFGARLLFIGLWSFADDQGYVDYSPKRIRMQVFPGDQVDIEALIGELLAAGVVRAYESPVGPVLHVANWARHQRVDKAGKARFDPDELRPFPSAPVAVPAPSPSPREESREVQEPSGSPREDSGRARESSRAERKGSGREGKGRELPPSAGREIAAASDPPDTTNALIGEWIEHCPKRPPNNVIGQVGKQIKAMLGEGIDPVDVRRGLAEWASKGLHPSALPSVVNEVMNAPALALRRRDGPQRSTSNARVMAGMDLADLLDEDPTLLREVL